jgi:hypothetical protein
MAVGLSSLFKTFVPKNDPTRIFDPAGIFEPADKIPVTPLPAPITRDDDRVKKARDDAIRTEKKRKGRKSTILTSGRGVDDDQLGSVTRPEARNAKLLGG